MFRKEAQFRLRDRVVRRVIVATFIFFLCIFPFAPVYAVGVQSLNGRYNIVLFGSDHATEFTSGIGYVNFDGVGSYSGEVSQVSQGQSIGSAFDAGPVSGTYSVDASGKLLLGPYDSGYISADGSLIVWAPVPGDIPYEETGINVGIKQASGLGVESLNGTYNMVLFNGNHASIFSCGIGYLNFDAAGSYTGEITEVAHGQSPGEALGVESVSGTYSVSPNGEFVLDSGGGDFTGYISTDASLIVWGTVPGDVSAEETGIGVAVKQGAGFGMESLNGTYNIVAFNSDEATEFSSGIAYVQFDGFGTYIGEVIEVSDGQSTGSALDIGPVSGTYLVDPNGKLSLGYFDQYDTGFVSADGSLIVWTHVPGDVNEETGIYVGIKKPSYPNLTGEYWFGSLSADANSWVPWGKGGTVIINGNNWYQEWDDYDGHHSFSGTFTTSVQPDGSLNINHAWGSYNVAWNGNIMINADTAPDAENHLGFDIIARKATNIDVNDVIGNYSFFAHWSDWYERDASVGWGSLQVNADGNAVATWVYQDGREEVKTSAWTLDDVNGIIHVTEFRDFFLCEEGIIFSFTSKPGIKDDFGYHFFVKESNEPITPEDIAGTYIVRFLETSVFGQPFTCGKGTAVIRPDGTLEWDAYYSYGEHDVGEITYVLGPGNRITFPGSEHEEEGIISPDKSFIFAPELQVPPEPEWWNWIGGIFLVRTACNIADFNVDRRVNFADYAAFGNQWLKAEPGLSANFNRDSRVDWLDLKTFAENWLWDASWY